MTGKRILAVENNDLVRSFIEDGLVMAGYEVDTARNGREAIERIDRDTYDLIISDMRMPEVDGAGLLDGLLARDPDALARLVFLASPDSLDDQQAFLARTGATVLTKPVDLEDLCSAVERMLSQVTEPVPL